MISVFVCFQDIALEWFRVDKRKGQESKKIPEDVLLHNARRPSAASPNSLRGDDGFGEFEIRKGHQREGKASSGALRTPLVTFCSRDRQYFTEYV